MIFGFLLAICFDPTIWTAATAPRWALLATALPVLCLISAPNHFSLAKLTGLGLISWAAVTLTWTANLWDGLGELIQILIAAQCFVLGSRLISLEKTFVGLAVGITASSLLLLIPQLRDLLSHSIVLVFPHGLFGNRNMLSETAVLVALGCLTYRRYWVIPCVIPAIFFYNPVIASGSWSRGAILALVVGLATYAWQYSKLVSIGIFAFICAGAIGSLALGYHDLAALERLQVWNMVWNGSNVKGNGLGSLYTLAPYLSDIWDTAERRVDHAHNELIEIYFELGIIGAGLYISTLAIALGSAGNREFTVLAAFLVITMVAFPWHIPANTFIGALVLGHAVRNGKHVRDLYHDGRILLRRIYESGWQIRTGIDWLFPARGPIQPV